MTGRWVSDRLGEVLPSWLVSLRMREVSLVTALDYIKSISGLYSRAVRRGLAPSVEVPLAAFEAFSVSVAQGFSRE